MADENIGSITKVLAALCPSHLRTVTRLGRVNKEKNMQNEHRQAEDVLIGHPNTIFYTNAALLSSNGSTAFPDMDVQIASPLWDLMAYRRNVICNLPTCEPNKNTRTHSVSCLCAKTPARYDGCCKSVRTPEVLQVLVLA